MTNKTQLAFRKIAETHTPDTQSIVYKGNGLTVTKYRIFNKKSCKGNSLYFVNGNKVDEKNYQKYKAYTNDIEIIINHYALKNGLISITFTDDNLTHGEREYINEDGVMVKETIDF